MFLTNEHLVEMTGYRRHSAQRRWLSSNGYKFDVRNDGKPLVLVDQVRERQCKSVDSRVEPDLSWMD